MPPSAREVASLRAGGREPCSQLQLSCLLLIERDHQQLLGGGFALADELQGGLAQARHALAAAGGLGQLRLRCPGGNQFAQLTVDDDQLVDGDTPAVARAVALGSARAAAHKRDVRP